MKLTYVLSVLKDMYMKRIHVYKVFFLSFFASISFKRPMLLDEQRGDKRAREKGGEKKKRNRVAPTPLPI